MDDSALRIDNLRKKLKLKHLSLKNDFAQKYKIADKALRDRGPTRDRVRLAA